MTKEEYNQALKDLEESYDQKRTELMKDYARFNCPYSVGDILKDHMGIIRVERIGYYLTDPPQCMFYGTELTVKLVPNKKNKRREMYQTNVIEKVR